MGVDPATLDRVRRHVGPLGDALDAVAADPAPEKLEELREAADKLMRALSRVLIELEQAHDRP
jgi:hypothetical protein